MAYETPPKAVCEVNVTEQEYVTAALIGSRRTGSLRGIPAALATAGVLLILGVVSITWLRGYGIPWVVPLILIAACPLLLLAFLVAEPAAVRRQAKRDYVTYAALMCPARTALYADNIVTQTPLMTLTDQYALMAGLVETPELLIFIKDRERMIILPKRCLSEEQRDSVLEQLRLTFIRNRRFMRSWLL